MRDLREEIRIGGCVDEFMQDQLVIFQALATGTSRVDAGNGRSCHSDVDLADQEGSLHTQTVRWVCEEMLRKKKVCFESGGVCKGIGWNDEARLSDDMDKLDLK